MKEVGSKCYGERVRGGDEERKTGKDRERESGLRVVKS